ncbi:MAG: (2Fe-2S)-binding protein [Chloroflexi bacterium]|jgi:carbon-monoxide dehydrogenase small subunit|nr:(2Fe-2S)-binding protein [Chloroflexota bacterium]
MYIEHVESGKRKVTLSLTVNDRLVVRDVDPQMTLLHFLRDELKLFGTKEACGEGECGACTVIMNGKAVTSCIILAIEAEGAQITTVEGLAKDGKLSILQEEFVSQDALQCGFCTPGFLMSTRALLDSNADPSDEEIIETLSGNLCRCTGYIPILNAVKRTIERERKELGR